MRLHQTLGMLLRLFLGCQTWFDWQTDSPIFATISHKYRTKRKKRSC